MTPTSSIPPSIQASIAPDDTVASENFLLIVSALVPYKRIDVAIEASRLSGMPLRIVGDGPERDALDARSPRARAPTSSCSDRCPTRRCAIYYRRAAAVLLPGEEDFGIVPVEAQACGTPVVALARGGALETVIDGVTGVLVDEPTPDAFAAGIARARQHRVRSGDHQGSTPSRSIARCSRGRFNRAIESLAACLGDTDASSWRSTSSPTRCSASWRSGSRTCSASRAGSSRSRAAIRRSSSTSRSCRSSPCSSRSPTHFQGVYRLRRGRSRVDDFFLVFIGTVVAVILGVVTHALLRRVPRVARGTGGRRVSGLAHRLGAVPGPQRRADVRLARARARGARAPLESRASA